MDERCFDGKSLLGFAVASRVWMRSLGRKSETNEKGATAIPTRDFASRKAWRWKVTTNFCAGFQCHSLPRLRTRQGQFLVKIGWSVLSEVLQSCYYPLGLFC
jgi:hypothetical protein